MIDTGKSQAGKLYLAIDQGGHSSRAFVYDHEARIIVKSKQTVGVNRPQPCWVEQDAEELYRSVTTVIADVIEQLGARRTQLESAALATQRSNVLCWDKKSGDALSPVISWQDRRMADWVAQIQRHSDWVGLKTGLPITAHYGASKLKWCMDNLPQVQHAYQQQRLCWGPLASYLVFRLSDQRHHYVDPANASRTLLWNIHKRNWDAELIKLFAIPAEPLPKSVFTHDDYGTISVGGVSVPLRVVTGDQSAALYAYGNPVRSRAYINIGTGAFIQLSTGNQIIYTPQLLSGIVSSDAQQAHYVLEATINGAGSALSKIEQQLGVSPKLAEQQFAHWYKTVKSPVLFLNGVAGLGAPYWVARFESRFVGDGSNEEKIIGVAESIVFLIQTNLEYMMRHGARLQQIMLSGGLAMHDDLCQAIADVAGEALHRPFECEATARGLAYLLSRNHAAWCEGSEGDVFTPRANPKLRARFRHWQMEMQNALRAY